MIHKYTWCICGSAACLQQRATFPLTAASSWLSIYCLLLLLSQGFTLKSLKHLVLDEADKLLDMDFEQEIDQILKVGDENSICWCALAASSHARLYASGRQVYTAWTLAHHYYCLPRTLIIPSAVHQGCSSFGMPMQQKYLQEARVPVMTWLLAWGLAYSWRDMLRLYMLVYVLVLASSASHHQVSTFLCICPQCVCGRSTIVQHPCNIPASIVRFQALIFSVANGCSFLPHS